MSGVVQCIVLFQRLVQLQSVNTLNVMFYYIDYYLFSYTNYQITYV